MHLRNDLLSHIYIRYLGMADYQHVIPIHADIARQKKRKWMDVDPLAGGFIIF